MSDELTKSVEELFEDSSTQSCKTGAGCKYSFEGFDISDVDVSISHDYYATEAHIAEAAISYATGLLNYNTISTEENVFEKIWGFIKGVFEKIANAIRGFFRFVMDFFKNLFGKDGGKIEGTPEEIDKATAEVVNDLKEKSGDQMVLDPAKAKETLYGSKELIITGKGLSELLKKVISTYKSTGKIDPDLKSKFEELKQNANVKISKHKEQLAANKKKLTDSFMNFIGKAKAGISKDDANAVAEIADNPELAKTMDDLTNETKGIENKGANDPAEGEKNAKEAAQFINGGVGSINNLFTTVTSGIKDIVTSTGKVAMIQKKFNSFIGKFRKKAENPEQNSDNKQEETQNA